MKALWTGNLRLGLISFPVKIYGASQARALRFRLLAKDDLCPVSYRKVCSLDGREIGSEEIVRGYEYRKGTYVVLSDQDLENASAERASTIEILNFARPEEVDPKYYDKPYYVEPDKEAARAYVVLREALTQSGKVGIVDYVLRDREHLGILQAEGQALIINQLRWSDEIRPPTNISLPLSAGNSEEEVSTALALINKLSRPFRASEYQDTYTSELKKLIARKAQGSPDLAPETRVSELASMTVGDLLSALKASLERSNKQGEND